jgi:hypothetical protein
MLKQCGDNLTRKNVISQPVWSRIAMLLPGIVINTDATDVWQSPNPCV